MNITPPDDNRPEWRSILDLGEQLLKQPTIIDQCKFIIETATRLFNSQVNLWFSKIPTLEAANFPWQDLDDLPSKPPTPLMRLAFKEGRVYQSGELPTKRSSKSVRNSQSKQKAKGRRRSHSIAIPLTTIDGLILGVLQVRRPESLPFNDDDIYLLKGLAAQFSIALLVTRQKAIDNWRVEQLTLVRKVSAQITNILNLDELARRVTGLIQITFNYYYVAIYTLDLGQQRLIFRSCAGPTQSGSDGPSPNKYSAEQLDVDPSIFAIKLGEGIIGTVAQTGETIISGDVSQDKRFLLSSALPDTQSELALPLKIENRLVGVLDIQSNTPSSFHEVDLLASLADIIAIAIRNADLYQSEQWRRQVADGLHKVAGLLSDETDLDQVLDLILTELERSLLCDISAIWLMDDAEGSANGASSLQLAAVHSKDARLGKNVVMSSGRQSSDQNNWLPGNWLLEAAIADYPIIRNPDSAAEPLGTFLGFPFNYSAIATPLKAGGRSLGVLTLIHHTSGRYGSESQAMTATFAGYAAVSIENIRLYEAAHEQAWISTVLLQVAEATQSLTEINELITSIVNITQTLVGINSCALLMWDDIDKVFIPVTSQGLSQEQQAEFTQWYIKEGEVPAFDHLYQIKKPILLQEIMVDPDLAERMYISLGNEILQHVETLVLFPLVARGELLGALLVDYSGNHGSLSTEDEKHYEQLAIIQGIAHQTAIAIENMRLLKAQKEEAYVSVALLQVAQALVSLNDLNDIIETIVRITPILAGVKRTAIYLRGEGRNYFKLYKSYGVPHNIEELLLSKHYSSGEFPFLDAVIHNDRAIFSPLDEPTLSPLDWINLAPPFFITDDEGLSNAEIYIDPRLLSSDSLLMMGFPLSVKGQVLGVMLAEESEPDGDKPSHQIRERRIEIINGITRQTALAIQNDLLQQEVVERERLERELQLAREIQRTFLPHHLPSLQGWYLDARWYPARQVGGDFYDILEFPDGRIGLVIADVADKGMPAALFMTLIRTLIRAAVHEVNSPSVVLERVNDLLVPDAQHGMFVTIVYAILDPNTGYLAYANAGHNPPLLLRCANREIERLTKGGMALGVYEGTHQEEYLTLLKPGDSLILYTDGITEAFSPDGEIYGEQRLHQVVQSADNKSPQIVIDDIIDSVSDFTKSESPSDDITILVIQRIDS